MGATEGFMRAEIEKLEEEIKTLYKKLQEIGDNNFELKKENKKLKKELECVYKAYHTAMGVDYDSEEDLYTNEDIEGNNVE